MTENAVVIQGDAICDNKAGKDYVAVIKRNGAVSSSCYHKWRTTGPFAAYVERNSRRGGEVQDKVLCQLISG